MKEGEKQEKFELSKVAQREQETLLFWRDNKVFEKSVERDSEGEFVFYDGPPFATGLPHYGHILAGTIKDVFPRYHTMKGMRVRRRWGWDCHGLPLENQVEKHLGIEDKHEIEERGIDVFNETAKDFVLQYADDWKKIVPRMGRFVDMENSYRTMDTSYSESIWWAFKELFNKDLIHKGYKSMHLCPRCETTLSNFEVNQGYKDITDISVYVKFPVEGQEKTYFLAWTTTPWTLPGNTALAVNPEFTYAKVLFEDEYYILAKDLVDKVFEEKEFEIVEEMSGKSLVGLSYTALFPYYQGTDVEGAENSWKMYAAPYVDLEAGTGLVHLAPAFGEEDYLLARENNFAIIHHVTESGVFTPEVLDFKGLHVKPKGDHQATDIEIIKYLAKSGGLFAKKKVIHSYPHCWRCETPLLNYATGSWFLSVTKIKEELIQANQGVSWVPENIRDGRFGKWLDGARDWAISRARYWGAPLPVWECEECDSSKVVGSIKELVDALPEKNTYTLIRHGQSQSNIGGVINSRDEEGEGDSLTEEGVKQVKAAVSSLKDVDLIVYSPLQRTRESAELIAEEIGLSKSSLIEDARLREWGMADFEGGNWEKYHEENNLSERNFPQSVETDKEVAKRFRELLFELDSIHEGKNILLVSHRGVLQMPFIDFESAIAQRDLHEELWCSGDVDFENAQVRTLPFKAYPHNAEGTLDLHKPYIDTVEMRCECGKTMKRIPEVFDCWFESGSMPFASIHYPFENKDVFDPKNGVGYPADFIAEGLDQTRGWFYTLLVLGVALFGKSPYKNVLVNGLVLAEDGQKMSKRLSNYPDPMEVVSKYGADALRMYMISSPIVRGEDLNFSEAGVAEVMRKIVLRMENVLSFYTMYAKDEVEALDTSDVVLDRWILARVYETGRDVEKAMENYELDRATRPFFDLADDISTWYLRRSRERLKGEEDKALSTLAFVIERFALLSAPFMPFLSETLFAGVKGGSSESVHLEKWPENKDVDQDILDNMKVIREIVSGALEIRAREGVKVRQPLQSVIVPQKYEGDVVDEELLKDELNVKEVVFASQDEVTLDLDLTEELREEGEFRDFLRAVQDLRKQAKCDPHKSVSLTISGSDAVEAFVTKWKKDLVESALLSEVSFKEVSGKEIQLLGESAIMSL